MNYANFSLTIFITLSLNTSSCLSASSKLEPLTARYIFIFGSVPEGLTTNEEPFSSIYFNTFYFGKLITLSVPALKFSSLLNL